MFLALTGRYHEPTALPWVSVARTSSKPQRGDILLVLLLNPNRIFDKIFDKKLTTYSSTLAW